MFSTCIHACTVFFPLSLQNSTLTIEEFHSKLQEATNFPLRPFVIPFLKVLHKQAIWKTFKQLRHRCTYFSQLFNFFFSSLTFKWPEWIHGFLMSKEASGFLVTGTYFFISLWKYMMWTHITQCNSTIRDRPTAQCLYLFIRVDGCPCSTVAFLTRWVS